MQICKRCDKENQDHYKFCLSCGAELLYTPPQPVVLDKRMRSETVKPVADGGLCPACGADVPPQFSFCGACGHRLAVPAGTARGVVSAKAPVAEILPRGRMTLVHTDGSDGGSLDLFDGDNKIGKSYGPLFEGDPYLSPLHAVLTVHGPNKEIVIRDQDSINGVFVRIQREEELIPGDILRVGQELLQFDVLTPTTSVDGIEILRSPNPGYWGCLVLLVGRGAISSAFPLMGERITLGRERGDISFRDDGYVSSLHATITVRNGRYYLADMSSSNGTFLKIRKEGVMASGALLLLGQQLFRVDLV